MESMPGFSEILRLAQSPEGQKLMAMLQSADSATLNAALSSIKTGDYETAKIALSGILENPEAQTLLKSLGGSHG